MKLFKKIIAAICAAATVLAVAGCADVTSMGTIEDTEIKAGVYLWYVHEAMDEAQEVIDTQLKAQSIDKSKMENFSYFDYKVEDKSYSQYVQDEAMESIKQHVGIEKKFEEMGLTLTEEERQEIKTNAKDFWGAEITYYGYSTGMTYGESYENIGISRQSYEAVTLVNKLKNKLFDAHYEENGITATDESDIKVYFNDNYGRFQVIQVSLTEGDGSAIETDEGKAEMKKLAQGYLDRLKKGEDFETIYHEYEEYVAEQKKLAQEEKDKENGKTSSDVKEESEAESDDKDASEDETTSDATSGGDEEEEEAHDHEFLLGLTDTAPSEDFVKWAFDLKEDEGGIFEDKTVYYVVLRKSLEERTDWFEEYRSQILHQMKDDEFDAMLNEYAKDYDVQFQQSALDAYKPENVKR